jgi:hypothetical protein
LRRFFASWKDCKIGGTPNTVNLIMHLLCHVRTFVRWLHASACPSRPLCLFNCPSHRVRRAFRDCDPMGSPCLGDSHRNRLPLSPPAPCLSLSTDVSDLQPPASGRVNEQHLHSRFGSAFGSLFFVLCPRRNHRKSDARALDPEVSASLFLSSSRSTQESLPPSPIACVLAHNSMRFLLPSKA